MAVHHQKQHCNEDAFEPVYAEDTLSWIREDFPKLNIEGITYLDNAATALYSKSQMDRVHHDLTNNIYCNPHTTGNFGKIRDVHEDVREMRHQILRYFNTSDQHYKVIFTSGATASCKMVADCFRWTNNSNFVYLDECHTSVVGMREIAVASYQAVREEDIDFELFLDNTESNNIFAFPAMSNFCGKKFPVAKWIQMSKCSGRAENNSWYVFLDAAAYVATNQLDLQQVQPDFICVSFYKIFGYPTGIGALLVKCSSMDILTKKYFGGGTVDMSLVRRNFHIPRSSSLEGSWYYQKKYFYQRSSYNTLSAISL